MRKQDLMRLLSSFTRATSAKTLDDFFHNLCQSIGSPRAIAAYSLFRNKEWAQLVSLEIDPTLYDDAAVFADDYLITKVLAKFPDFSHEELDPEGKALQTFLDCEATCKSVNRKFLNLEEDPSLWDPTMRRIFLNARRKIASVLRRPDLQRISDGFGWGPGATTSASGSFTSAYSKFKERLDITSNALMMGQCCVNSTPAWSNCQLQTDEFPSANVSLTKSAFNLVRGNEIVFVPKNAKTHRIIAKEPHVNSYLQKGFGREIRRLLLVHAGVDLKDQTRNQQLAQLGSLNGELATIDLSGASDTISYELVRFLLPKDWFQLLDMIRSKQGFLTKDTWIYYHKFSSMGNACTFELESLIFWALCECAQDSSQDVFTSVYGDDIIVPSAQYENVAKVIDFAGFTINASKSFSSGPFRESCGKDYFLGHNVRPIFLKETISNVESLYKLANSVRRYAHRRNSYCGCDIRYRTVWQGLVDFIPGPLKHIKVPEGFGDAGLMTNFDEATPSTPGRGWGGFMFSAITRHPIKRAMRDSHSGYTTVLSVLGTQIDMDSSSHRRPPSKGVGYVEYIEKHFNFELPLRGLHSLRMSTYPKVTRIHTHGWYDLGPWNKAHTLG